MIVQARQAIVDRNFFNFFKKQCITYRNCNKLENVQRKKSRPPRLKNPFSLSLIFKTPIISFSIIKGIETKSVCLNKGFLRPRIYLELAKSCSKIYRPDVISSFIYRRLTLMKESSLPAIRGDYDWAIVIFCDTYQTGKKKNILQIKWTATFLPWPCWFRQNLGGWYFFVNGSSASRESPNRLLCFFNRFLTVSDSSHFSFFCSEALIFAPNRVGLN